MNGFTPHARERALERYQLLLSDQDMRGILTACQTGKALCGRSTPSMHAYLMQWRGKTIVPILNFAKTFIITFFPQDYFVAGRERRRLQAMGKAKQRSGTTRHPIPEGYQRKRITIAEAEEER